MAGEVGSCRKRADPLLTSVIKAQHEGVAVAEVWDISVADPEPRLLL